MPDERQYFSKAEAANYLNVVDRTIDRFRAEGKLPCVRLGQNLRFRRAELDALIAPNTSYVDREAFLKLLVEANEQRKKSAAVQVREAAMRIDPKEAVQALRTERKERDAELLFGRSDDTIMVASNGAQRSKISPGSMPFLEAALDVADANRKYWPLSFARFTIAC